ncbi:MAG: hypothetical protein HQL25_04610 [Candidatus Omnitrophica bacterium]|nr:hypothetical protein [Candidatus Omnitrophota bacterium]
MENQSQKNGVIPLLGEAVSLLLKNPAVSVPFITIIFFELLILEFCYFSTRFPLVNFMGPVIQKLWGVVFLHYPNNLFLLPKMIYPLQVAFFLLAGNFLMAVSAVALSLVVQNQKAELGHARRIALPKYFHVLVAAILFLVVFLFLNQSYSLLMARAFKIKSTSGMFFMLKAVIIYGAPYFNLLLGCFATALFAFFVPFLVIAKKNLFSALISNFKLLFKNFGKVLLIVLIPTIFYIPFLVMRASINEIANVTSQEMRVWIIAVGYIMTGIIDAIIYTALTKFFLSNKE